MTKLAVLALLVPAVSTPHIARIPPGPGTGPPSGEITVAHTRAPIRLNGRMEEPVWTRTDSITDFRQREPDEGAPATERTVVRVATDNRALYIAVRAEEPASEIRASQLRPDADLRSDDYVSILIDSFDEQRSALVFETNPNGARVDGQLEGSAWHPDMSWNGIWDVAVHRDPSGWTAEFRIPFETLRFRSGATAFGFNVRRFIRARNEEDLWRAWRRTQGLDRLVDEGQLTGLGGARRGTVVALRPYVLTRAQQAGYDTTGTRVQRGTVKGKFGLNAKLPVTGTLTADLTVNTDFAQVEADQQKINLSRYPLFFPEKREFFLESSGIFNFGSTHQTQMFYSRRIGLNDSGPVPILGGARVYGRAGPWVLGLLDVRTGKGDEANDAVVRIRHDVLDNSYVGLMATSRAGPGVGGVQRAAGVDGDFPLVIRGRNLEPSFWVMTTDTSGTGTRVAWRASVDFPNDLLDFFLTASEVQGDFAPTLGFVSRTDVIGTSGHVDYRPRPNIPGLRRLDFKVIPSWQIEAPVGGSLARPDTWESARFEWRPLGGDLQSGDHFELNLQRMLDAPTDTFDLYPGVVVSPGRYWWTRGELQYRSGSGDAFGLNAQLSWGGFYDGSDLGLHLAGTWRAGGHLILEGSADRDAVRLPGGRFTALVLGSRVRYAFTTRSDFLAYVQYNGENRTTNFDLRFHWVPAIGDDVYVVWTSGYSTSPAAAYPFPGTSAFRRPLEGALVVKAVYRLAS